MMWRWELMKQHKQWLWPLMLLMMGLVLVVAGCGTSKVAVSSVAYRDMPIQISADANVSALNKATITPTVSGQVSSYMVKTGDQVKYQFVGTDRVGNKTCARRTNPSASQINYTYQVKNG